jgi:hypothetical protein
MHLGGREVIVGTVTMGRNKGLNQSITRLCEHDDGLNSQIYDPSLPLNSTFKDHNTQPSKSAREVYKKGTKSS